MERSLEQRYAIKFCAFKEGREEVADEPRSGRPTTARTDENVDRVLEVLRTGRRLSIQQIADTLHMSTFVVHGIVTEDLQMRKVCAKLVPKVLMQDQKELRVLRCQELLDLIQNEPGFLNSVVTGDESWMFEYDPESKRQSCAWHTKSSPRPKKARMSKSRIKTMIIVFFDIRGIVHCELVPQGQTVNSAFYLEVLRRLKRRIARVRTDIKDTVKLHHDNATSHTAFIITNNFLARSNTPVIPHPPYSPDLAPCDLFLFPRLKREMKGKHWETGIKQRRPWHHKEKEILIFPNKWELITDIVKIPLDPVWISWNKVRLRLTRVISPKPWSLGGRFSVCQSWCFGFVTDPRF
ncbi:hypothetical protein LAZ67_15000235 [Cordylochernes scorpioides]|uniref:Transposase n=1 Tax=Cordylochernes scorpioides TaxID=51811 RepID=A0ABY6LAF1_9ARAC|nr:hypothetical protein LAZ67_15000235 [Cordylochernes scorpioides]